MSECVCPTGKVAVKAGTHEGFYYTSSTKTIECTMRSSSAYEITTYELIETSSTGRNTYSTTAQGYQCIDDLSNQLADDGAPYLLVDEGNEIPPYYTSDRTCESVGYETQPDGNCIYNEPDICQQEFNNCNEQCGGSENVALFSCTDNIVTDSCTCQTSGGDSSSNPDTPTDSTTTITLDTTQLENSISSLDTTINSMNSNMDNLNSGINGLNTSIDSLDNSIQELSLNTGTLSSDVSSLNTSVNSLDSTMNNTINELANNSNSNDLNTNALNDNTNSISNNSSALNTNSISLNSNTQALQDNTNKLSSLKDGITGITDFIDTVSSIANNPSEISNKLNESLTSSTSKYNQTYINDSTCPPIETVKINFHGKEVVFLSQELIDNYFPIDLMKKFIIFVFAFSGVMTFFRSTN